MTQSNDMTQANTDFALPKILEDLQKVREYLKDHYLSLKKDGYDTETSDASDMIAFVERAIIFSTRTIPPQSQNRAVLDAAQAVIDRWETPLWKDVPATAGYIHALRDAIAASTQADEVNVIDGLEDAVNFTGDWATPKGYAHFRKLKLAAHEHLKRQKGR